MGLVYFDRNCALQSLPFDYPELRKVGFLAECFECRAVFGAEGAHVHLVAVADFGCVDMIGSLEDEAAHNLVAGKVDGSPGWIAQLTAGQKTG